MAIATCGGLDPKWEQEQEQEQKPSPCTALQDLDGAEWEGFLAPRGPRPL
jgi:hypothetical protein